MHFFINECSLCEQFYGHADFRTAVTSFLKLVERARGALGSGGRMWRSEGLANACALPGETLHRTLNHVAGSELSEGFKDVIFNKANPAPWESEREHLSEDRYFCKKLPPRDEEEEAEGQGRCVTDTSMAEVTARRLRDAKLHACLLNMSRSPMDDATSVEVAKGGGDPVTVACACAESELEIWLRQVEVVPAYTPDATDPPRDEQTCLGDVNLYEPTNFFYDGRRVYRHIVRRHLCCVDNLHFGRGAHLEVFDKHCRHIGTASLDGQLDPSGRVEGRKLPM